MYTINHMWIANIDGLYPEGRSKVFGLYKTLEDAKKGLHLCLMKIPNNGCVLTKDTDERYSFISPDGKTRGYIEIQKIEEM